ncbi:hypothetical protein PFISCL1PPCAC_23027, partial [Pristionchus fissidentatus]
LYTRILSFSSPFSPSSVFTFANGVSTPLRDRRSAEMQLRSSRSVPSSPPRVSSPSLPDRSLASPANHAQPERSTVPCTL